MKRCFVLILALVFCLSLTACSADPAETAPASQEPEPATPLNRGAVNGNIYTNKSMKLRFDLPSGWSFYSEDEIAEINNMTKEMYESADLQDAVAASGQFIDFFAASSSNLDNVNLIIQPANAKVSDMTEREIFESSEESYRSQFAGAGMEIKTYEVLTAKFCGAEKAVLHMETAMSGITLQEYQLWIRTDPNYTAVVTVSSTSITDPQTILDYFTPYN